MGLDQDRWNELLNQFDVLDVNGETFALIEARYGEPHRKYHNSCHIVDCLSQFDRCSTIAEFPDEVELALWFHDVIYDLHATDNELQSANWASDFLRQHGVEKVRIERVQSTILATQHNRLLDRLDEQITVDIDLSIFGRPPHAFDQFEAAIREEYSWVPLPIYVQKRTAILQSFLDRQRIYSTDWFAAKHERQARGNLQRSIKRLEHS